MDKRNPAPPWYKHRIFAPVHAGRRRAARRIPLVGKDRYRLFNAVKHIDNGWHENI